MGIGHILPALSATVGVILALAGALKGSTRTIPAGNVGMVFFFGRVAWNGQIIEAGKVWIPFWYKVKLCYVEDSNTDEGGEVTVERHDHTQACANATLTYKITRDVGVQKYLTRSENYADQVTSFFLAVVGNVVASTNDLTNRTAITQEIDRAVRLDTSLLNYGVTVVAVTLKTCAQTQASAIASRLDLRALLGAATESNVIPLLSSGHNGSTAQVG